jgi:hypothetical protein
VDGRLGTPGADDLAEALIGSWGAQDPQAAADWVMKLDEETRSGAASTLLALWAETDPNAAAEWAARFPAGETRSQAIPAIATAWAELEPEKAVAWTLGLPDSPEQRQALDDSVRAWTALSPENLGTWVGQQPQNEATDHLRNIAAGALIESNPQQAMTMAAGISDPARREHSLSRLFNRWNRIDPAAAKSWTEKSGVSGDVKLPPP